MKYRVYRSFTRTDVWEIEAKNSEDAIRIVNDDHPQPVEIGSDENVNEYVDVMEG